MFTPEQLTRIQTHPDPMAQLRKWDALNPTGLGALISAGTEMMGSDLDAADRTFAIAGNAAEQLNDDEQAANAQYQQARVAAMHGQFDRALTLIETVRTTHFNAGRVTEGLTTTLGEMWVRMEMGAQAAATQLATDALVQLNGTPSHLRGKLFEMRGIAHQQIGNYSDALADFDRANENADFFADERLAQLRINRAWTLTQMGEMFTALQSLEQIVAELGDSQSPIADDALLHLAHAQRMVGRLETAWQTLETVIGRLPNDSIDHAIAELDLAEIHLALNLVNQAIHQFDAVIDQLTDMPTEQSRALWGRGTAAVAMGESSDGLDRLRQAYALYAGNAPKQAMILLEIAHVQREQGELSAAQQTAEQAFSFLDEHPLEQFFCQLCLFDITLARGALSQAANHLQIVEDVAPSPLPNLMEIALTQRQGQLARRMGDVETAEALLRTTIDTIETMRGGLQRETTRTAFLHDKTTAYSELILLLLAQTRFTEAFEMTERTRSRTLIELMQQETGQMDTADSPELVQLQADLNALYNELLAGNDDQTTRGTRFTRVVGLEQKIERLLTLDQRLSVPPATDTTNITVDGDHTVVSYFTLENELLAFVITADNVQVVRNLTTTNCVHTLLRELERQWLRLRIVPAKHHAQLEQSAQHTLYQLYNALFAPIAPLVMTDAVIIVPHGALHTIPFHALHDGAVYLIDHFTISYAPSVTTYALCQTRPQQANSATVLGVSDAGIEHVAEEVAAVSTLLDAPCLQEEAADRAAFLEQAETADILHVACHGLFRQDNPRFSALRLGDGWLYAHEIAQLTLPPALVTLSACESARSTVLGGDELLGLPRAFLGAGAATVVASLWLADDAVTAEMMPLWYQQMENHSPAEALRSAQLTIKERFPHPYLWGSFILLGRRGKRAEDG